MTTTSIHAAPEVRRHPGDRSRRRVRDDRRRRADRLDSRRSAAGRARLDDRNAAGRARRGGAAPPKRRPRLADRPLPSTSRVVRQVGEADVGNAVVLTFKANGKGTATVRFGLTKGETAKAFESRRVTVVVR